MPIDAEDFATRAGLGIETVQRLSGLDLIPSLDALDDDAIPVARLVAALERSGVPLEQLADLVAEGGLTLEHINRGFVRTAPMQRGTFEGLAADIGVSASFAEDIRLALGVADDGQLDMIRVDDAEVLRLLAEMVDLGVGESVVVALFHVMAESLRRMARASSEMWSAGVRTPLIDSGMSFRDMVAAENLSGDRLQAIGVEVVSTVWSRFLDDEIFHGTVELLERALEEAGLSRSTTSGLPTIAFMDLTAFTAMTDRVGDDAAAAGARDLRAILKRALVPAGGTLVKMLGDGAMLHFPDAVSGAECAVDLVSTVPEAGLPDARFGLCAGPLIVKDVDFYGHTVNVAARLVDYARPSEVLVTAEVVEAAAGSRLDFAEIGRISLKGIADPVHVFSASSG